jgi:glycogen synthase
VSRGLSAAQAIVAPTRAMLDSLRREYGELPHGHVIYNGAQLTPSAAPQKEPFVLSAGRLWDPAKNIGQLEHAALLIKWPIFVAGAPTGPDAQSGPALSHVRTLGLLSSDDLASEMRRAAIYALPALYEPFGLSILEAASARCALVLGDIPSLRELWNGCASFVDPRDPAALAEALTRLISSPALRAELADNAQRRATEYSAERMGTAYLALYERLSEGRSARARVPRFQGIEARGVPTSMDPRQ